QRAKILRKHHCDAKLSLEATAKWFRSRFKRSIAKSTVSESSPAKWTWIDSTSVNGNVKPNHAPKWPLLDKILFEWQLEQESLNQSTTTKTLTRGQSCTRNWKSCRRILIFARVAFTLQEEAQNILEKKERRSSFGTRNGTQRNETNPPYCERLPFGFYIQHGRVRFILAPWSCHGPVHGPIAWAEGREESHLYNFMHKRGWLRQTPTSLYRRDSEETEKSTSK
ncbi:hypothetical protein HF325_003015, partial [Metschnikowia pulcherrima]